MASTPLATFGVLLSLAVPASAAAAPTLQLDRPCYAQFTDIGLTGSGFTPGGPVGIAGTYADGTPAGHFEVAADPAGSIEAFEQSPQIADLRDSLTITARDIRASEAGAPPEQTTASAVARLSTFGILFRPWNTDGPARGRPGRVRRLEADGLIRGPRVLYVHYRLRGRVVKTLRVGRLSGPCGSLRMRFREFAYKGVRPGTYRVRFNQSRSWSGSYPYGEYRRVVIR
jgi:hypothetical protein